MTQTLHTRIWQNRTTAFGTHVQQAVRYSAILLALMLTGGCATIDSLKPGSGTDFTVSERSYQDIWNAAIVAATSGLAIVESDKSSGAIKAESKAGFSTWGEVVGIFISPQTENSAQYSVEVQSLKRARGQLTGQDWERTIIERMKAELKI